MDGYVGQELAKRALIVKNLCDEDLADVLESRDGAISAVLTFIYDGPIEFDSEYSAYSTDLFRWYEFRTAFDLTSNEQYLLRVARGELNRRVIERVRYGRVRRNISSTRVQILPQSPLGEELHQNRQVAVSTQDRNDNVR